MLKIFPKLWCRNRDIWRVILWFIKLFFAIYAPQSHGWIMPRLRALFSGSDSRYRQSPWNVWMWRDILQTVLCLTSARFLKISSEWQLIVWKTRKVLSRSAATLMIFSRITTEGKGPFRLLINCSVLCYNCLSQLLAHGLRDLKLILHMVAPLMVRLRKKSWWQCEAVRRLYPVSLQFVDSERDNLWNETILYEIFWWLQLQLHVERPLAHRSSASTRQTSFRYETVTRMWNSK
jgi:hypothetical protein